MLIYFDDATKRAVLARLAARLAPDGYLVLGAAETTTGISHDFAAVPEGHHGIFRFTPEAAAAKRAREEARASKGRGRGRVPAASHRVSTIDPITPMLTAETPMAGTSPAIGQNWMGEQG